MPANASPTSPRQPSTLETKVTFIALGTETVPAARRNITIRSRSFRPPKRQDKAPIRTPIANTMSSAIVLFLTLQAQQTAKSRKVILQICPMYGSVQLLLSQITSRISAARPR